jgi:hypothetical protein
VRTKIHRKDWHWPMSLVYNPRELLGVTTVTPEVNVVLQFVRA